MQKFKIYFLVVWLAIFGFVQPTKAQTEKKLFIPILMYHYIRDYYNINDPLGINLSVAPKKFTEQLETIKKLGYNTITFEDVLNKKLPAKPIILTFDDGYEDFCQAAYPLLKQHQMKAVTYIIANRINAEHYMTLRQLKEISKNNIEIGGHTWSHPDLRNLNAKGLTWEIKSSKNYLTKLLQKPIISFAYPAGKFNSSAIKEVADAGYNYAVTTENGEANLSKPLTLKRFRMFNSSNLNLILKLK